VARPLEFKKRVRMREDAPVELPARKLPPWTQMITGRFVTVSPAGR